MRKIVAQPALRGAAAVQYIARMTKYLVACSLLAACAQPKLAEQSQQISGTCFWDGAGVLAYCGVDLAECLLSEGPLCEGGASFTQECAESWGSFQADGCLQACPAGEYLCAWEGSIQCCWQ